MKKILHQLISVTFFLLFSGCIHEHPDEEGIDPTLLTVEIELSFNLEWKDYQSRSKTVAHSDENRRRFIVEVQREGQTLYRQTCIPVDFDEGQTGFTMSEPLTLHALEYTVAVWADYTGAESEDGLHYDATNLNKITINTPYTGNTDYRDCHYATALLDLRPYRDQWNARVQLDVDMVRPLAKYQVIATDVKDFMKIVQKKYPGQTEFNIRFSYGFYFPLALNAWEGKPAHVEQGVVFPGTFTLPADGTEELLLGSDYIFVNGTGSYIPLSIEITTESGELVSRPVSLNVPYQREHITTLRGRFLTSMFGSGGVGIDPDFDGDIDIDLDTL